MRKNVTFDDIKMMVGPMEGVMTPALIIAANRLGLTRCWMTSFLRVSQELYRDSLVKKFVEPFSFPDVKVIVQLMGNEPDLLSQTVTQLKRLNLADGINLNFGCPSRRVTAGSCGGGALRDINLMQNIIRTIRNDHPEINLSAKIRLGYSSLNEMEQIIPALTELEMLDFMVIHCRVVSEGYGKIFDHLARFERAKKLAGDIPIVVNGDIDSKEKGLSYMQKLNVQGFMSARPWLANPFMFVKDLPDNDDKELLYSTVLNIAENELKFPYSIGKQIELSNLIFGKNNPYFEKLKQEHHKINSDLSR